MSKRSVAGFIALMIVLPGMAWAVGLGQIQSDTHIGQTLEARIPILAASPNELQGLTIALAPPDAYRRAGLREADFLYNLKFRIKQGAHGPYVLVTSTQPVHLPFLNLLVHAHWASGDVTREYTLLLNPPVFAGRGSAANVAAPSTPARERPIQRSNGRQSQSMMTRPRANPGYTTRQPAAKAPSHPGVFGPVSRGETLWSIASRLRPNAGVSVNQMMIALYRANPRAFSGNINRLKSGARLHVPSRSEIRRVSHASANRKVASQNRAWRTDDAQQLNSPAGAAAQDVGKISGPSADSQGGEVVLTAPEVDATTASGGAPAAGAKAIKTEGATAAAGSAVAQGTAGQPTQTAKSGAAMPAASTGGPAKARNGALANLAAAPAAKTAHGDVTATGKAGKAKAAAHRKAAKTAVAVHNTKAPKHSHKARATPRADSGVVRDWLTSPKGWIVIALIVLLLIMLGFLFSRRVRARRAVPDGEDAGEAAVAPAALGEENVIARADADAPAALAHEATRTGGGQTPAAEPMALIEAGAAAMTYTEASVAAQEAALPREVDAARAQIESDQYASRGDFAAAARVLRRALAHAPERDDLRLRLLEALFAAGDATAFRAEAETLHWQVPEPDAGWQATAVMGRRLLPGDPLFAEAEVSADAPIEAVEENEAAVADALDFDLADFDLALDRLGGEEPDSDLPSDFATLGEPSTISGGYVPENDELTAGEKDEPSFSVSPSEDEELEFTPEDMQRLSLEGAAAKAGEEVADARSRLDLARAYLDMGDFVSARSELEALMSEGDETQREEARHLLAEVNAAPTAEDEFSLEAAPVAQETPVAESGTATPLDLARAYLDMGEHESAREILEEVLDGADDEPQRENARKMLAMLDA